MTDQDQDRAGTLSLLEGFRKEWMNGVGGLDLQTQDPVKKERLYDRLTSVAGGIESMFQSMIEMRKIVRNKHPYHFGVLLNFLSEIVTSLENGDPITRFEVMQSAGYWPGRRFNEWANEVTEVKTKTWQGWCNATERFFDTDEGKELLEDQGLTQDDWIETVPIGKAIRATAALGRGDLEAHHVEALVDDMVTEPQLNMALKTTKAQHEQALVEEAARDEKWVREGSEEKTWVEYEPISRCVVVKEIDASGHYTSASIAKMVGGATVAFHGYAQQQMIDAALACQQGESPGLFEAAKARAEEKVEVKDG